MVSIEPVGFGSSEFEFGTSVISTVLAWASKKSPSGSWMSSYVPSANDVISICNAVEGKLVKCLSTAFLHYKLYTNKVNI